MEPPTISILGQVVQINSDYLDIHELKFLADNPRLCGGVQGIPGFEKMPEQQQQEIIFQLLQNEPSVKDLIGEVRRHGGLLENILICHKTREVIEGNSRLAVYRMLCSQEPDGEWEYIPCNVIVDELTLEQRAAFLNQVHVKGKSEWSAFAKANFAFDQFKGGWNVDRIARVFGESTSTIYKRIKTIELMKSNGDTQLSNFSYYKVMIENKSISSSFKEVDGLKEVVLEQVKIVGKGENNGEFTAVDLRNQLPVIVEKPKALKKFIGGSHSLREAYIIAEVSTAEANVKRARDLVEVISERELTQLDQVSIKRLKHGTNKLKTEVQWLLNLINKVEGS